MNKKMLTGVVGLSGTTDAGAGSSLDNSGWLNLDGDRYHDGW